MTVYGGALCVASVASGAILHRMVDASPGEATEAAAVVMSGLAEVWS